MTAKDRRAQNVKPADALPEWFNDLAKPKDQPIYTVKPKRMPVSDTPIMVLAALAFTAGACLALLILGELV